MRKCVRLAILALLLILGAPGQARADFMAFLDYLENLSGPGPFRGPAFDAPILCADRNGIGWLCLLKSSRESSDVRRIELAGHFSYLFGKISSNMDYPADLPDSEKEVDAVGYGWHITPILGTWGRVHYGATLKTIAYTFHGRGVLEGTETRVTMGVGPVFRVPITSFNSRYMFGIAPMAVFGLSGFSAPDFRGIGGRFPDDKVKLAIHAGFYLR